MSAILNLPDIRPSLLLDFANSGRVDPRIQCVRASEKIVRGVTGGFRTVGANVPALDFNPVSKACRGMLLEPQVLQIGLHTHDFTQTAWSKGNVTIAPNGRVTELTNNAQRAISQAHTFAAGEPCTLMAQAKHDPASPNKRYLTLLLPPNVFGANVRATFDLENGVYHAVNSPRGVAMDLQADGSYLCAISHLATAAGTAFIDARVTNLFSGELDAYQGDGVSGFYLICANITKSAGPSSIIRSGATASTRAADAIQMPLGDWFNPSEGTFVVEYELTKPTAATGLVTLNRAAAPALDLIGARFSSGGQSQLQIVSAGTQVLSIAPSAASVAGVYKRSISYKVGECLQCINGVMSSPAVAASLPAVDRLLIGSEGAPGTNALNDAIKRIAYYPRALTALQHQRVTAP